MSAQRSEAEDPRLTAAIDLIGRTGAQQVQIRYSDDEQPTLWLVAAKFPTDEGWAWEAAGAKGPLSAALRLLELVLDGGACAHCGKTSGVWEWWEKTPSLHTHICWYVLDPELGKFRRSCEGETSGRHFGRDPKTGKVVRRNDPCPCESGKKFKHCHGA